MTFQGGNRQGRPLVVDLDGTLVTCDVLRRSLGMMMRRSPWRVLQLPVWQLGGRVRFKQRVAQHISLEPVALPYNDAVLSLIEQARADARPVLLATASHQLQAEPVARHLAVFDEVLASSGSENLKSGRKAAALVARFGVGGFDYVGNSHADIPVWRCAARCLVTNPDPLLMPRLKRLGFDAEAA